MLSAPGWTVDLGDPPDTSVTVRLVSPREYGVCSPRLTGCAVPVGHVCLVMLDREAFLNGTPRERTLLLAHEVGHCLDASRLEYTHGGFRDEGRAYSPYHASPVEGFAEAYAHAYLARCGPNLAPLGWGPPGGGTEPPCTPPDPREIRPDRLLR